MRFAIKRAGKVMGEIGRKLATDKMIVCLIVLLLGAIIAVVVVSSLGLVQDVSEDEINCSLVLWQTNKACEAERAAAQGQAGTAVGSAGNATVRPHPISFAPIRRPATSESSCTLLALPR